VVRALGAIRDPRAIPLLLKVLDEDTNPSVLEKTERALKKLTDIPTLIEGLKSEHPVVQDNATYVLWLMTAKDFKQDYDKWKQWWEKQQGSKE
jgi:HEAT repeat protein